jgi:cytochrome c-type biogenesis protein CcmE
MLTPGKKLAIGGLVIAGAAVYMAYLGASSSWRYYVTTEECISSADLLIGSRIRVSGKVSTGTLRIRADRSQASFSLAGTPQPLPVVCAGIVPDNLVEDMEVVVEGRLEDPHLLHGDKVLTRCASKYRAEIAAEPLHTAVSPEQGKRQ